MSENDSDLPFEPVAMSNSVYFKCQVVGDPRRFEDICKEVREEFEALGPLLVRQRVLQMELAEINDKIEQVRR